MIDIQGELNRGTVFTLSKDLGSIGEMRSLGFPLLIGSSRKSVLGRISGRDTMARTFESAAASER